MVADVLLHPGMSLSFSLKRRFASGVLSSFIEYPHLAERLRIVYPLFALKWCLIMLNEFFPEIWRRRQFAGTGSHLQEEIQMKQLRRAEQMLHLIMEEYERFPYYGSPSN